VGTYQIVVLAGDGLGPEVVAEAVRVLCAVGDRCGHTFRLVEAPVGQQAIEREGSPISEETIELCRKSDAVLFGAVSTLEAATCGRGQESAILRLRKALDLFANLRPVRPIPALVDASPLRPERLAGVDLIIVRELTGGIYYGRPSELREGSSGRTAVDTMTYSEAEIERVMRFACEIACARGRRVTSVDKSNVLACSRLWRETAERVACEYPHVELRHMLVDTCAMNLLRQPAGFDVIVTENLFGDILSDQAAMLTGSLGLLPSASLGARHTAYGQFGLYEPVHGSAPDIARQGIANPVAAILCVALLLRHSLGLIEEATMVEQAVHDALTRGARTRDLGNEVGEALSTRRMGEAVLNCLA
jgi:3-isopropylmalate dehydrogenase